MKKLQRANNQKKGVQKNAKEELQQANNQKEQAQNAKEELQLVNDQEEEVQNPYEKFQRALEAVDIKWLSNSDLIICNQVSFLEGE